MVSNEPEFMYSVIAGQRGGVSSARTNRSGAKRAAMVARYLLWPCIVCILSLKLKRIRV